MIKFTTDNIASMPYYTNPGAQFNHIGWQMFVLKDGSTIDVLFQNDEFVTDHSDMVKEIEKGFNKKLIPGTMNGEACLIHTVTKDLNQSA